jgi:hypothetical protein
MFGKLRDPILTIDQYYIQSVESRVDYPILVFKTGIFIFHLCGEEVKN